MKQYIDKSAVVAEIDDWRDKIKKGIFSIPLTGSDKAYATFEYEILGKVRDLLDTLEVKEVEEPSKDLEEAAENYVGHAPEIDEDLSCFIRRNAFIAGAQWKKEQMITKACVFLESTDFCKYYNREFIKEFKKAMKG